MGMERYIDFCYPKTEIPQLLLDRLSLCNEYLTALKILKNRIERGDL